MKTADTHHAHRMYVFVVASRKGGAGKTTTSRHLGVGLSRRGYSVMLMDTDEMCGLSKWWHRRKSSTPPLLSITSHAELPGALERLRAAGVDFVIVDTPPQASNEIGELISMCDLVVIPSKASPDDLDPLGETVALVEAQGKPMVFVLNEVRPKTRIESQAILVLSQHGKVAPSIMHYRQQLITASITGQTMQETDPSSVGAEEIHSLIDYLLHQLGIRPSTRLPKRVGKGSGKKVIAQPVT